MIDYGFTAQEALDLTVRLKSQQVYSVPDDMIAASGVHEETGRDLFMSYCSVCHGADGRGTDLTELSGKIGPTLCSEQLLSLMDSEHFYQTIVEGRSGTAMPAWNFMNKQELADLMSYLDSWRPRKISRSKFNSVMAKGSSYRGERWYYENCAACHGDDREGGIGPSLNSPEFLAMADNRFLYNTVTKGRRATGMAAYTYLGENVTALAVVEDDFLAKCIRCRRCGQVCPNETIKYFDGIDPILSGTPHIGPRERGIYHLIISGMVTSWLIFITTLWLGEILVSPHLFCRRLCPGGALFRLGRCLSGSPTAWSRSRSFIIWRITVCTSRWRRRTWRHCYPIHSAMAGISLVRWGRPIRC